MSEAASADARDPFSPRTVLALVMVGLVAFAGFVVLATYAPEFRARGDVRAHALSSSAIGYRGATVMLKAMKEPVTISQSRPAPRALARTGVILTPGPDTTADDLRKFPKAEQTLIVLPKWRAATDPVRPGFVRKVGFLEDDGRAAALAAFEAKTELSVVAGTQRPLMRALGSPWTSSRTFQAGKLDGLQTIRGPGWTPVLVDAKGRAVMVESKSHPGVFVLSEPDFLNNQGLNDPATARAGMEILTAISREDGLAFDVTLNGLGRGRSLSRLMLEPPWIAATLCLLATAALMGWLALTRFGAAARPPRAIALGATALVDNSAGLVRLAKKEPKFGSAYAESTLAAALRAGGAAHLAGEDAEEWLARAAARKDLTDPRDLAAEAAQVKTNDELTAVAAKLHRWRLEMTGESS